MTAVIRPRGIVPHPGPACAICGGAAARGGEPCTACAGWRRRIDLLDQLARLRDDPPVRTGTAA